jgi:spore germination protein
MLAATTALLLALPAAAQAYSSAWLTPFDETEPADWACFDELNPFALAFDASGRPRVAYPALLERAAAERSTGTLLLPTIVNDQFAEDGRSVRELKSQALLEQWLGDGERLDRHVEELAALAEPYDGIELDYERIPDRLWGPFVELVEKLADKLHAKGKKLAVAVESGPLYSRGGAVARKHWPRLAAADRVKIMCYYERGEFSSEPGPGSSSAFVAETGRRALALLPAPKVSLALSLAATDWQLPLSALRSRRHVARLHYRKALQLRQDTGDKERWDDRLQAPYFRYKKDGKEHAVYYEDERSLAAKTEAARRQKLGVSVWYLGRTKPDLRASGVCL